MAKADEVAEGALADRKLSPWEMALRATGARLCYGEPVKANGRTVIPVASVEAAGGGGWGKGEGDGRSGRLDRARARAAASVAGSLRRRLGFIEIGPEGTRFRRIIEPVSLARGIAGATAKGVVVWARERKRRR